MKDGSIEEHIADFARMFPNLMPDFICQVFLRGETCLHVQFSKTADMKEKKKKAKDDA